MSRSRILRGMLWCTVVCIGFSFVNILLAQQAKPEPVYRLTLRYRDGVFDSLRIEPLRMILPLTVKEKIMEEKEYPTDYFFVMYDSARNVVLRSHMDNPTLTLMEYEDPDNPGRIIGHFVEHDEITFSILVPAPTQAVSIMFARVAPGQDSLLPERRIYEDLGFFDLVQE